MTQKEMNPFLYSDTHKRYHTYAYALRRTFGEKVAKIPLDLGCTCPNLDGTKGTGGCIYCSGRGSGDFAPSAALSLAEQYAIGVRQLSEKWKTDKTIAYFQAHTNTYASTDILRDAFTGALTFPGAVGLNIATRADCLAPDVLALLAELAEKTRLTVELGLQTASDVTAARINRCHTFAEFTAGYAALRAASQKIRIAVHLIDGLPGETGAEMLASAKAVASLRPDEVKIHLLHILRGTALADEYTAGKYIPMTMEDYAATVAQQIAWLPPETVIGRITGDGKAEDLLAPLWSRDKKRVMNAIDRYLFEKDLWQGKMYDEHSK